MGKTGRI
jgi:transposase